MKIHSAAIAVFLALAPTLAAAPAAITPVFPFSLAPGGVVNDDALAEWENGAEKPITARGNTITFGNSKRHGPRHLRIAFHTPQEIGSILVLGGGRLSVLKPGAPVPGDMADESQWIPAQRFSAGRMTDKVPGTGAAGNIHWLSAADNQKTTQLTLWVLPPGTVTSALRFTHTAAQTDLHYAGTLGAVTLLSGRFANIAPLAVASASADSQYAGRISNETAEGANGAWANINAKETPGASAPSVSPGRPEWTVLTWPAPVALGGLVAVCPGFASAEAQAYAGPEEQNPRDAGDAHWERIGILNTNAGDANKQPQRHSTLHLPFEREITTRAIRVKITAPLGDGVKPAKSGKRVWLGELLALSSLGATAPETFATSLAAALDASPPAHPPIPIRFTLPRAGRVTLVIENPDGTRVRNLFSDTPFPAGENTAWWDGCDDLGRDPDAAMHGVFNIPARPVAPGKYRVRGLVRDEIKPHYEFSVYASGNPPWNTADASGAWLANHTPPQSALFIPADQSPVANEPLVLLGCFITEGPAGLAWVTLDGRKLGGKRWVGGHWTAAPYMARDTGDDPAKKVPGDVAYVASAWESGKNTRTPELRITAVVANKNITLANAHDAFAGRDREVIKYVLGKIPGSGPMQGGANEMETIVSKEIGGIAVYNGLIAVSLTAKNQLMFVDARSGGHLTTIPLDKPRGLAFDAQGRLLAISGKRLVRYDSLADLSALPAPAALISTGLEAPAGITINFDGPQNTGDARGTLYISDHGNSHQVKVFSPDGKPLRTIGNPGAPAAGAYDPLHMNNPFGLAVDSRGRLWVAENDFLPKRVSIWTPDGKLAKAIYGPGKYGGGGTLDPVDRTRFYYADEKHGAMEFRLDWDKGGYELARVYHRASATDMPLAFRSAGPETPLYFKGRRYFTNCYNSNPTNGHGTAFLFIERDGLARPCAAMGRAADWAVLKTDSFKKRWPEGTDLNAKNARANVFFIWHDLNGDAQAQPNEVSYIKGIVDGVTIMPDLSFCVARLGNETKGQSVRFAPVGFTNNGAPRYDISKPVVLAEGVMRPASSGGAQVLVSPLNDGWTAVTLGIAPYDRLSISGAQNAAPKWSYPNPWPGLHASHRAPAPDRAGQLIAPTRLLGGFFSPGKTSDAGPLWATNTNHGRVHIFTRDGLLAATLFEDMRKGKIWRMPSATRNMPLDGVTLGEENFWPTITSTSDGNVYIVDGARSALIRLDGIDSIRRLADFPINITASDLEKAAAWRVEAEAARQRSLGSGTVEIQMQKSGAPDWGAARFVDIDKAGVAAYFSSRSKPYDVTAALAVSGDRLHAQWRTGDPKLLANTGEQPVAPFKTGGALDIMIGADAGADPARKTPVAGDQRLLITVVKGKPLALLYRAVVPGTKARDRVPFSSPWRTIHFDRVDDVSAQIQFTAGKDGVYEIAVPLKTLGLAPDRLKPGAKLKGDIGILRGDGNQTTARLYWHNKATGIVSDVPDEAMLRPALWGAFEFR
ncbi:hypothetical protein [Ereboglobus luteus]|uniref:SMP-30/Gluconolactonase/LRE-like region domain-containing protein n=1 Tax=Ereboglobus luteus TaxID=1796921 RepID=A0A2U8E3D8_9BACT|nr:hypothetical protein [Ereboglobus luteus]AWI09331.1 hypothetical protein CKA38_08830 [Ereboglobus luteus]